MGNLIFERKVWLLNPGSRAKDQLVNCASQTPDVLESAAFDLEVVHDQLRCGPIQVGVRDVGVQLHAHLLRSSKVCNLACAVIVDENVCRLQVAVHDSAVV